MAILVGRETKLLTVGFTSEQGTFHSLQSRDYGTDFVGGVAPGKGDLVHEGFPVFNTVSEAIKKTAANTAMVCVPPFASADAILECIDAEIPLVVCITKGIPVLDMLNVKHALRGSHTRLIGPNSPGIITPGECKVGNMPGHIHMPGKVGVISRSGTLTYEIVYQLTQREIGQSTCVGLGGDFVTGTSLIEILEMFEQDKATEIVVMIGEIGCGEEMDAARWINKNMTKPVLGYIPGESVPKGKTMGDGSAIIEVPDDSAEAKYKVFESCGVVSADSPAEIGKKVEEIIALKQQAKN